MKKGLLVIDSWSSKCADCGRDCDPNEKKHITNLGYSEEIRKQKGCGVKWKYVTTGYAGTEERVKEMRPDLKFVDFVESLKIK